MQLQLRARPTAFSTAAAAAQTYKIAHTCGNANAQIPMQIQKYMLPLLLLPIHAHANGIAQITKKLKNTRNASSAAAAAAQTCMCTWNAQVTQKQIQMPMHPIQMQLCALSFNHC